MLVLTRKIGESIRCGDEYVITVKKIKKKSVKIGLTLLKEKTSAYVWRKIKGHFTLNEDIVVRISNITIKENKDGEFSNVSLAIDAPRSVTIVRSELLPNNQA